MINTHLLKLKMYERGITSETLANDLGISRQTLSLKINNKREFFHSEIIKMVKILKLSEKDFYEIFFSKIWTNNPKRRVRL